MSAENSDDEILAGQRQRLWDEVREYNQRRAVIEQAKGMLMVVFHIDADEAFHVLRSHSQERNVKLCLIAEQIQNDLVELAAIKDPARKLAVERVLRTASQRVDDVAHRQLDGRQRKTVVPMKDVG